MSKEIVVLTADSLRHDYIRQVLAITDGIDVLRTYREISDSNLLDEAKNHGDQIRVQHLERRARSEHDYFAPFVNTVPDRSNPVDIQRGDINNRNHYEEIIELAPDLLVAYGCSIIEDPLLSEYEGQFLNLHLGLSPYYRGTGTNFWPLVNGEPEYVGATFMHLAEGVDTGKIIHQLRARVHPNDSPHDIGHRLIADAGQVYPEIVRKFDDLAEVDQPQEPENERYYTSSDYSVEATEQLYENFENGLIEKYLSQYEERTSSVPLIRHSSVSESTLTEPRV